jgi:putative transposase
MKKSKFTEEQIAFALHQADTGTSVEEVCRKIGISQATFYAWKKKFGGMGVSELRQLRQIEEENRKLKQLVADLSLYKVMLQDVMQKKPLRLVRQTQGQSAGRTAEEANARDCLDTGAVRVLAHLCAHPA